MSQPGDGPRAVAVSAAFAGDALGGAVRLFRSRAPAHNARRTASQGGRGAGVLMRINARHPCLC